MSAIDGIIRGFAWQEPELPSLFSPGQHVPLYSSLAKLRSHPHECEQPSAIEYFKYLADADVSNKGWPGHTVFDMPDWTRAANDLMIQEAIRAKQIVYLASPTTARNMFNIFRNEATQFGREVQQLLGAGYRRAGDYLLPPGGP